MLILPQSPNGTSRLPGLPKRTTITLVSALCFALVLATNFEARPVLLSTGNGTENTTPPSADPGFDNVGVVDGLSGVYVGNGWVLTANHVGEKPIQLQGVIYDPVPGSRVRFQNPDLSFADLMVFKLLGPNPPLPALAITDSPPALNTLITIIGNGRNRGTDTTWMGIDGWNWGTGTTLRWGTNKISQLNTIVFGTQSFWIVFDDLNPGQAAGQDEADLVTGDSGGAAFTGSGASAELIGILFARAPFENQPANTSLFGNGGIIANLFAYRSAILAVIDQPDCSDGLDDDGDGLIDFPDDPGCSDALDPDERGAAFECDNGIDDDDDGLIDFPDDDGCLAPTDQSEAPPPVPNAISGAVVLGLALYGLTWRALRRSSIVVE